MDCAALQLRVEAAIAADLSLLDAEAAGEAIFRARYGDERWASRQSYVKPSSNSPASSRQARCSPAALA